jgi:hypothetical protein
MRLSRTILVLALFSSLGLLSVMGWQVGMTGLLEIFRTIGPWIVPFLLLETIPTVLHTAGWAACFQGAQLPVRFWQLWLVRLAGSAVNQLTPTAMVGGEVVRVLLLETVLPREHAIAPVLIGKATATIAQMMYLSVGTLFLVRHFALPSGVQVGVKLMLVLASLGLVGFVACQRYGALSFLVRKLACLPGQSERFGRLSQHLHTLDSHLVAYYTHHPWRFVQSVCFHGLGFAFASVKVYILLRLLLGPQAPQFSGACAVAIAVDALDQVFFFVPGRVLTLESVRFTVLTALGVTQVYSLAFGLTARIEQLVWSGLGLLAYGWCTRYLILFHSSPSPVQSGPAGASKT